MELIIDFIFEVLLEGSFEIVKNKKLPIWLRILVGIPLVCIYGGLFVLFTYLIFDCLNSKKYLFALLFMIIDIGFVGLIIHLIKKEKKDETKG